MSRTFVEVLREKYCADDDENDDNFIVDIIINNRPRRTSGSSDSGSADDDVELAYLKNVVLCNTSIEKAGIPSNGLCSLCPNVIDLDLSSNSISDWEEVLSIFTHLPALQFINLSRNPLGQVDQENSISCVDKTFGIKDLVLNNTHVTWNQAVVLASLMPNLQELHLCQNGYTDISASSDHLSERLALLKCLRLNQNKLSRWEDVAKLGHLPELHTLILSDNPLQNIAPVLCVQNNNKVDSDSSRQSVVIEGEDDKENTAGSRSELGVDDGQEHMHTTADECSEIDRAANIPKIDGEEMEDESVESSLSVPEDGSKSNMDNNVQYDNESSAIDSAESDKKYVEEGAEEEREEDMEGDVTFTSLSVLCVSNTKLGSWSDIDALRTFPKLTSVKIKNIPLHQEESEEDRRRLLVASLPKVNILNGSEVTQNYLDKSEHHFIRFFGDKPDPPKRYKELVQKHGELKSLATVDIGKNFREYAKLSFIYGGRCIHQETVHVIEPVRILKKLCSKLVKKSPIFLKIYYLAKSREEEHNENGKLPSLEELCLECLPMSRYDMMDGDEIHIDVQSKPQRFSVSKSLQTSGRHDY